MSVEVGRSPFVVESAGEQAGIESVPSEVRHASESALEWFLTHFGSRARPQTTVVVRRPGQEKEQQDDVALVSVVVRGDDGCPRVLVRMATGSRCLTLSPATAPRALFRRLLRLPPTPADIIHAAQLPFPDDALLSYIHHPAIFTDIVAMEERQLIRSFKFGIVYLKDGQSTEEHMFQHQPDDTSMAFREFLDFLGDMVELKGWPGYRAGLDVVNGQTGTHSVFTKWKSYDIMFHVSPLLPFSTTDSQQIERKRHIGNDIVVIVFQDSDTPFKMETLTSHQNHVLAFVRPVQNGYKLAMCSRNGTPAFGPPIPSSCIFENTPEGRDFFLYKLVNGERASYESPNFAPKINRTRAALLNELLSRYSK